MTEKLEITQYFSPETTTVYVRQMAGRNVELTEKSLKSPVEGPTGLRACPHR